MAFDDVGFFAIGWKQFIRSMIESLPDSLQYTINVLQIYNEHARTINCWLCMQTNFKPYQFHFFHCFSLWWWLWSCVHFAISNKDANFYIVCPSIDINVYIVYACVCVCVCVCRKWGWLHHTCKVIIESKINFNASIFSFISLANRS